MTSHEEAFLAIHSLLKFKGFELTGVNKGLVRTFPRRVEGLQAHLTHSTLQLSDSNLERLKDEIRGAVHVSLRGFVYVNRSSYGGVTVAIPRPDNIKINGKMIQRVKDALNFHD